MAKSEKSNHPHHPNHPTPHQLMHDAVNQTVGQTEQKLDDAFQSNISAEVGADMGTNMAANREANRGAKIGVGAYSAKSTDAKKPQHAANDLKKDFSNKDKDKEEKQENHMSHMSSREETAGNSKRPALRPHELPRPWLPSLLQPWDEPFTAMRRMTEEMDHLFARFIRHPLSPGNLMKTATQWIPSVEVSKKDNQLVVCVDLPGIKKDDIHIDIDDGQLIIEGERSDSYQSSGAASSWHSERTYGHFYRSLPLPPGVDPEQVKASIKHGVLEITVPLPARVSRSKRLEIQSVEE